MLNPRRAVCLLLAAGIPARGGVAETRAEIETEILIIGGGSTGTYAAVQLADLGKDIVLIERRERMGGHADTYTDPETGRSINVGVQVFHNTSLVRDYFGRLGVAVGPPAQAQPASRNVYADFGLGTAVNYTPPTSAALSAAFRTYEAYISKNYPTLEEGYGFIPDPVPQDLLLPFSELAKREGFQDALKRINGFDQPDDVLLETALYALKSFGPSLVNLRPIAPRDVNELYRAAARELGDRVLFNSSLAGVRRTCAGGVVARVQTPAGVRMVRAKKLLMTAYPLLSNLDGWDLTAEESSVFGKFVGHSYMAGVIRNVGIGNLSLENTASDREFGIPAMSGGYFIRRTPFPDTCTVYYGSRTVIPSDVALANVLADIDRMAGNGLFAEAETEVLGWYDHSPTRLYVSPEDIAKGFYRDLYALQGTRNTWWSGAAWQTQDSSQIWYWTSKLIKRIVEP